MSASVMTCPRIKITMRVSRQVRNDQSGFNLDPCENTMTGKLPGSVVMWLC
jgi:hypothetical protein